MKLELAKVNVVSVASELKRDRSFVEVLKGEKGDEGKKGDAPILFVSGSGDASELRYKYTAEVSPILSMTKKALSSSSRTSRVLRATKVSQALRVTMVLMVRVLTKSQSVPTEQRLLPKANGLLLSRVKLVRTFSSSPTKVRSSGDTKVRPTTRSSTIFLPLTLSLTSQVA